MNLKKIALIPLVTLASACSPLTLVNGVAHFYDADVIRDVSYGDDTKLALDYYLPNKSKIDTSVATPVIVFFYGGSWNDGDKKDYSFVGRRLASQGYIVAVANYRLYPQVTYPDFLYDSAKAVAQVMTDIRTERFKDWHADDRVFLMGHSAGAYNTAMLALDDRWLQSQSLQRTSLLRGWIGLAGPYDLYPINLEDVRPVFHYPDYPPNSNPIEFVDQADVPALLLAPEDDNLVDTQRNTYSLAEAMTRLDKPHTMLTISGTSHITIIGTLSPLLFFKGSTLEPINTFIQQHSSGMSSTLASEI
ncbi:MAG: alpha/beta hydrolase [Oleibacter sp.]|nr:alpha/beta hydrolase [Thalassolituus sp.]